MPLTCPHCQKLLDFAGETPRFCAYCGQSLALDGTFAHVESSTLGGDPHATTAHVGAATAVIDDTGSWNRRDGERRAPIPRQIADYRIVRKLGEGGMGTVHEAEDLQTGRRVALKLMAPEFLSSTRAIERFLQEGRLASTIAHPRCVFVLAADEADGWPFIVMELMPGTTLKDLVERSGPMSSRKAIETILDVIEGLEEAHRRGVIHRDVKPSNCFVEDDGRIKVGDFGLSKSVVDDSGLTRTGTFIGTPHFASPEQIKGEEIDERSDVYSVCATLYYLLTGHAPFEGGDAASTLAKIVSDPLPSARIHRPDLWVPLDRVICKGLERDRKRRWANLEELRAALSPFLPGRVTLSSVGLRIAAYVVDSILIAFCLGGLSVAFAPFLFQSGRTVNQSLLTMRIEVESGLFLLVYWLVFEVLGEASPGKRMFRLRIGSSEAGPATWRSRVIRLGVFAMLIIVPRRVAHLTLSSYGEWIPFVFQLIGPLILFIGARPSNGNRGLHDFASGAAVVRLPWRFRRRGRAFASSSIQPFHLSRHAGMPEALGAYTIEGSLRWSDDCRLLSGRDDGLQRPAWIVMRPDQHPNTPRSRTDLARLARTRWLSSGQHDGWRWDAYVAPVGAPLALEAKSKRRRGWSETREILDDLATELFEATCDGTLPSDLGLNHVWIKPNGRVLLVDVTPHGACDLDFDQTEGSKDPQERGLDLLARVCSFLLDGSPTGRQPRQRLIGTPIPRHAVPIVEGLWSVDRPYRSIEEFRKAIHAIRGLPSELTPLQQFGHAVYTLFSFLAKIWMVPLAVVAWLFFVNWFNHLPPPLFSQALWERCLLFETLLWVALGMIMRGGLSGLVFNVALTTRQGQPVSRFLFGWRELLVVGPVLFVNLLLPHLAPTTQALALASAYGGVLFSVVWPLLNLTTVFFKPGRYLIDYAAGTVYVPR